MSQSPTSTNPSAQPVWPVLKRMFSLAAPYKGRIALALVLMLLAIPGDLLPGIVAIYLVDHVIQGHDAMSWLDGPLSFFGLFHGKIGLLISACTAMSLVYVVCVALDSVGSNLMERTAQRFIVGVRQTVYDKLQSQSLSYLHRQRVGDLMSRAMGDVSELQSFITGSVDVILKEGLAWIATVTMVMIIDWRVALATIGPIVAVYLLLRAFNKKVAPIYKHARESLGRVSTRLQENLSGVVVIKIFGREKAESQRFAEVSNENYQDQVKSINARTTYFPIGRVVGFCSNLGMFGVGGWLILTNRGFSVGELIAFRSYWWRLFGPVYSLARVNDMVMRASAAGRRVFEVLDTPAEVADASDARDVEAVEGAITFENVDFGYATAEPGKPERPVLHGVNLHVAPGQRVALCGPSGAGKSTLLGLMVRFYDPTSGRVLVDGRDLRLLKASNLRARFGLVQQETFLFHMSVLDNIRYGKPDATPEQAVDAAKAADAHEFITKLTKGYDTEVGERGVRLSGGQKQRISIARAFLADPDVLLLDEPTSSVEPDSENAIIAALDRLMSGRTTILTSHRPALVAQADIVYVIEHGRVTDFGPPAVVRQRNDWFDRFLKSVDIEQVLAEQSN